MNKITFLLFILFCGCSSSEKNTLPLEIQDLENLYVFPVDVTFDETINIQKKVVFGGSDDELIGRMGDIVVDNKGRVFISDLDERTIHVFDSEGLNTTKLGGEGRGPGDFTYLKSLQIRDGYLYVVDTNFGIRKVVRYNLENLDDFSTIQLGNNRDDYEELYKAYPGIYNLYVINNESYLAEFVIQDTLPTKYWQNVELTGFLYLLDSVGNINSSSFYTFEEAILVNKAKALMTPIRPFFGTPLIKISRQGDIYITDPQLFLIKKFTSNGEYEGAFYYPVQQIPLNNESAKETGLHEYYINNMEFIKDLPSKWPVINYFFFDDEDRMWIAVTVDDMSVYSWWVLDSTGQIITKFNWSRNKRIQTVSNNKLYTVEESPTTFDKKVVRYSIKWNE